MASVMLYFAFPTQYPILDFRALWSLGIAQPKGYTFQFWESYLKQVRDLSAKHGIDIRELDMALWQYSKEEQK